MPEVVYFALCDTLADWEIGYAMANIANPDHQNRPGRYTVRTVAVGREPITTMGGLRIVPDVTLDEVDPATSAMLVLPGNDIWPTDTFTPFTDTARAFLDSGVPVAAICGATGGLAQAGLLDDRAHTSNAPEFLNDIGYGGAHLYRDEPAVVDGDLVTASGIAPVDFARAIFERLDLYPPDVLTAWYKLYGQHDPSGYYELTAHEA